MVWSIEVFLYEEKRENLPADMFQTLSKHYFVQFSSLVYKGMQQK